MNYSHSFNDKVFFELIDAAIGLEKYQTNEKTDITHIYSYNKVMSKHDRKRIAETLNRTNFKILAWYFTPVETRRCGLRDVVPMGRMRMQSTGKENFTCYLYLKTALYFSGIEDLWSPRYVYSSEDELKIETSLTKKDYESKDEQKVVKLKAKYGSESNSSELASNTSTSKTKPKDTKRKKNGFAVTTIGQKVILNFANMKNTGKVKKQKI